MHAIAIGCAGVASESPVFTTRFCQHLLVTHDGDEAELLVEAVWITQPDLHFFFSGPVRTLSHL